MLVFCYGLKCVGRCGVCDDLGCYWMNDVGGVFCYCVLILILLNKCWLSNVSVVFVFVVRNLMVVRL